MLNKLFVCFLVLLTLSACASGGRSSPSQVQRGDLGYDDPTKELSRLSIEVVDELRLLSKTRDYQQVLRLTPEQREQRRRQAFVKLEGFDVKVSMDFVGEAHVAAKVIAQTAGYDFISPITSPARPLVVTLKGENKSLREYLLELGAKTGRVGQIRVHTEPRKTLQFDYATEQAIGL